MGFDKKVFVKYLLIFAVVFFGTRIPRLSNDTLNTDAVYWHGRSQEFIEGIKTGNFEKTNQKYHPGVTTMWVTGLSVEFASLFSPLSPTEIFANHTQAHFYAKLGLVTWHFILSGILFYLLSKIFDIKKAFFMILLFSIEPFFLGNARILHHDVAISLYLLIAFSFAYLLYKENQLRYAVFTGIFLGLAVLTKTLFLGALLFVLGGYIVLKASKNELKAGLKPLGTIFLVFLATYVILFPAMWVHPIQTIVGIFEESYLVGNESGHKQIFFGQELRDPGPLFYPVLFGLKLSLVTIIGFIIYYFGKFIEFIKNRKFAIESISYDTYISIFYFGYFLIITYFSKKVDRYVVPIIPFLSLIAVLGFVNLRMNQKVKTFVIGVLSLYTIVYPLFAVFPHYLLYTNPIFGNAADSNEIIGQKLFGIGVYDLRDTIIENYGEKKVATYDPGPLQMVYGEDKVFDISKEHPNSYDLIILGPNKDFPKAIMNEGLRYPYKSSVVLNGMEFWRIYGIVY